jgi:hypothetical protein
VLAGMAVSQCGHVNDASGGLGTLDNSTTIDFLSGILFKGAFFARVVVSEVGFLAVAFSGVVFSAIIANTIYLKCVAGGQVMVFAADLLLDFSDLGREKFDRGAAFRAHHVVMAAAVVLVLEARNAVMKGNFAGESTIVQQLQRPVDGGKSNAGIFFLDQAVQFVGGEMFAGFEKRAQNRAALPGLLQAYAAKMLQENGLGLADALARDAGLIVDSLL